MTHCTATFFVSNRTFSPRSRMTRIVRPLRGGDGRGPVNHGESEDGLEAAGASINSGQAPVGRENTAAIPTTTRGAGKPHRAAGQSGCRHGRLHALRLVARL